MHRHYQVLSQIKHQVRQSHEQHHYKLVNEKKNDKYYSLYLDKITLIQRKYRQYLNYKGKRLKRRAQSNLQQLSLSKIKNEQLKNRLKQLKEQNNAIQNINPNIQAASCKQMLEQQVKITIKNIFDEADQHAKIIAVFKSQMLALRQVKQQNSNLEKENSNLQQKVLIHQSKNDKLQQKVKQIRDALRYQKNYVQNISEDQKAISTQPEDDFFSETNREEFH